MIRHKKKHSILSVVIFVALIVLVSRSNILDKLSHPLHYEKYVYKYSAEYEIDPYLVFAIIRTESKFFPYAKSRKDAKGLMQIAPITENWAKEELNKTNIDIYDPKTNIKIGCWYLSKLMRQFDDIDLVIAAYNGGSGNVDKWLSDNRYSYNGINLTNIPFKETRQYVTKVKQAMKTYEKLYKKR
ncbi:lytic transglycosylase domain-containing protein [Alkalithermobacter paradoxus]|uniref:Membrane-bound lytic murein transglycosylase C n=1 Tax=Alkalithermobacter paradoxus TaxID=29349 RepID=A0A1V4I6I1_9FIRM|nr:membrane-bound lytic murein transglycosylase C precursor [[Clostridium] thermoalcaliphilum]